jgi:hypothetical protein
VKFFADTLMLEADLESSRALASRPAAQG